MLVNSVHALGAVLRGRRLDLGLTQAEVAARAGVSRPWLSRVEKGRPKAEIGLIMSVLDSLGLRFALDEYESVTDGSESKSEPLDLDAHLAEYRNR